MEITSFECLGQCLGRHGFYSHVTSEVCERERDRHLLICCLGGPESTIIGAVKPDFTQGLWGQE